MLGDDLSYPIIISGLKNDKTSLFVCLKLKNIFICSRRYFVLNKCWWYHHNWSWYKYHSRSWQRNREKQEKNVENSFHFDSKLFIVPSVEKQKRTNSTCFSHYSLRYDMERLVELTTQQFQLLTKRWWNDEMMKYRYSDEIFNMATTFREETAAYSSPSLLCNTRNTLETFPMAKSFLVRPAFVFSEASVSRRSVVSRETEFEIYFMKFY